MPLTHQKTDWKKVVGKQTKQKLAITVLSGGPSAERKISLESGKAVGDALASLGHTVHVEDISPDNLAALAREVDCVFVALHGTFGEDGQVQTILEKRKLAYVGSGPDACSLAMDKAAAKAKFTEAGLPTPRFTVATPETIRESIVGWSLPVVVKPVKEGSSLACHIVRDFSQFRPAVESVIESHGVCLIEDFVPGREITVGILGERPLPPIEIRTQRDFYDYNAKYVDEDTEFVLDIDLPDEMLGRIVKMSLQAHLALGCRDFSRVDWRVDDQGTGPWLLEVNVVPGLTAHSLLPKAAESVGLSMATLCRHLVEMAVNRKFSR